MVSTTVKECRTICHPTCIRTVASVHRWSAYLDSAQDSEDSPRQSPPLQDPRRAEVVVRPTKSNPCGIPWSSSPPLFNRVNNFVLIAHLGVDIRTVFAPHQPSMRRLRRTTSCGVVPRMLAKQGQIEKKTEHPDCRSRAEELRRVQRDNDGLRTTPHGGSRSTNPSPSRRDPTPVTQLSQYPQWDPRIADVLESTEWFAELPELAKWGRIASPPGNVPACRSGG